MVPFLTMATKIKPGDVLEGPDGQRAIRMGPGVAVGQYFVIHPDHGGHYVGDTDLIKTIESWPKMVAEATPKTADTK